MSAARVCDNCDATLTLDRNGEDENDEINAWIQVRTVDGAYTQDACTRSCAVALLADGSDFALAVDARLQAVAEVVRVIREDREANP